LPDSVRCTADSSNAFTCDVQIDADLERLSCEAPEPLVSAPPPPPAPAHTLASANPAVAVLVANFVSKTQVPVPPAPLLTGAAVLDCASSELSVALAAVAASKNPLVATISMFKAGLETGSCLVRARNEATLRHAIEYCDSLGGTVLGIEGDKTVCAVRESGK